MPNLQHAIADLCFEVEKARTYTSVRETLTTAAEAFGTSYYMLGMRTGKTVSPPAQIILSNYPKQWQRYYDEQGAHAFDPVILKAFQFSGPFRWDGLHQDERQLALRRESIENGMEFGFSCPDRGPDASIAMLSFCGRQAIASEPDQWEATEASIRLLVSMTHKALIEIVEARDSENAIIGKPLSYAELQALGMMANAMTAQQAADKLGVQERTIRYYLDSAADKLGVETRKEAVLKAVADGIVDTREFPHAGFDSSQH